MSRSESVRLQGKDNSACYHKFFTLEEANRSLVLVRKIVKDILSLYCRAKLIEEQYSVLDKEIDKAQRSELKRKYQQIFSQLKIYERELREIGCHLRDWQTGAVEWPAILEDREIYLCWRMGESEIGYWHEAYESFAGRRKIDEDFFAKINSKQQAKFEA